MRKSHRRLVIFDILIIIILLLNSFISSILSIKTYWHLAIFLLILLAIFKYLFGYEKDSHRYTKDIIMNLIIVILISFILYYLSGLFIDFVKTTNYYSLYGLTIFIIPYIIVIILREFLRYQMIAKSDKSKLLITLTTLIFIITEIMIDFNLEGLTSNYKSFMFLAMTVLPAISRNIVATYICKKTGYKPNILWLLIIMLYSGLIPIVPDTGIYIGSIISFLYPIVILYNVYSFFQKRERNIPLSYVKKTTYIGLPIVIVITFILVYFVSGNFRFHAIAIASGSMTPNIHKGDVVIIDKNFEYDKLKVGDVIAYKYDDIIVVHRLVNIIKVDKEFYYYTQGDANEDIDNYIIYENMVLGTVNFKVPYIGIPTVWLNEL